MKLVLQNPNEAPCEPGKDLNVVILCVNPVTVERAAEVLKLLEHTFKADEAGRLVHEWWDYEVLGFSTLREMAVSRAAAADVIILGVHGGNELPWMVADWMKRWLDLRNGRPGALVAVLDADLNKSNRSQAILSQLKESAGSGQMDFFATEVRVGRNAGMPREDEKITRQFVRLHKTRLPGGGGCRRKRAAH